MSHFSSTSLTPPPAHLRAMGHTPPAPHIQIHPTGSINTPPPAHMNTPDHRSSPGLQLLGHVAASPQLRIHGSPSPNLPTSGSPAHLGLLTIDRPTSRESFSMTPPRAQVFPHAGVQPELLKVLRPNPHSSPNTLMIPVSASQSESAMQQVAMQHAAFLQQQQAIAAQNSISNHLQQMQYLQTMQEQAASEAGKQEALLNEMERQRVSPHHVVLAFNGARTTQMLQQKPLDNSLDSNHLSISANQQLPPISTQNNTNASYLGPYRDAEAPPEPSPHHQLKLLAKIASSELVTLNNERGSLNSSESHFGRDSVSPNLYNQRIHNLDNFPTSSPYASSYRSHSIAMQRARSVCITGAAKSLDVLREVMQSDISVEIQRIIDSYISRYFRPALENIKDNKGENSVGEEHIQCLCQKMLAEAGKKYTDSRSRSRSATPMLPGDNMSEVGSTTSERPSSKLPFGRKRKVHSDTESEASSYKKGRKRGRQSGSLGPSGLARTVTIKREGPRWNPDRLNDESLFIMGSKANKALGLGNARGRIYLKHPELFKYSGDADDKLWLYENHRMPVTGGKAYMMILDDIQHLAASAEYKNALESSHLRGFTVPSWMIEKVQKQMVSLRTDAVTAAVKPKIKILGNTSQQEQDDVDSDKNIPFKSAASSRKSLSDSKLGMNSPANTEEMELLSSEEQEDQPVSPFGSAEDYAPVSPGTAGASSLKPPSSPNTMSLANDRFGIA
ncbi:uncharacterized protein [Watersipora subatra]|uniref:uncharacterized protein n=1 Tax=Watersipora subatra TaxID=2589382 RepID=UPI00355C0B7D